MIIKELRAEGALADGVGFVSALVLPERGMMLAQLRGRLPDGREADIVTAPPALALADRFGGADDFAGNASFGFGGAILVPYANRVRGRAVAGRREIETTIGGKRVRLPANWRGKSPVAETYAMHGLILDRMFEVTADEVDTVEGVLSAGSFGGRWPSATDLTVEWRLSPGALELTVTATNAGDEVLPMGIGWHPYFALPSGDRRAARLHVAASSRVVVGDYDAVPPTGAIQPVAGSAYDFRSAGGALLGDTYLDDCFVDLDRRGGTAMATLVDPGSGLLIRVSAAAPPVRAFQVYAPPDQPFVAIEPQFNLADPYGREWHGGETGMVRLAPGQSTAYTARVGLSAAT